MSKYEEFKKYKVQINDIVKSIALLNWDQETKMPKGGMNQRAQQIATLSGIVYDKSTSPEYKQLLSDLSKEQLAYKHKRNVAISQKECIKDTKFDKDFITKSAKLRSECFQAWNKAKANNDFSMFEPKLSEMVQMKRQEAEILGYTDHPYTALMDYYEPDMTTTEVEILFDDVKKELTPFIKQIAQAPQVNDDFLYKHYDSKKQWDFGINLLKACGYNFDTGRQDVSAHPFTIDFGAKDVRITTRIEEKNFMEMTWSTLHECGHAVYEQGLPIEEYGLPSGSAVSLGIHESQSRLYENNLGRSFNFWQFFYPYLQTTFSENLANVNLHQFFKAINKVTPSFIRTNADELTYHSHIMIRFEIEKALIEGSLKVKDLPTVWNTKYKKHLGIDVPSDTMGCLQDVHWSHGSFGYFPTYSIGSFYATQFYNTLSKNIDAYQKEIMAGNYQPLLNWLRENIHQYGSTYTASELCERVTGEKLNFKYFMEYAQNKFGKVYGLKDV